MNWDKFKGQFHESWHGKIQRFIESKECDEIYAHLKERSKLGHKIAPLSSNTYRCFLETDLSDLKVVLLGYCPYHTFINNEPVADGLMFSCGITNKQQPSLELFLKGLETDLYEGLNLEYDQKMSDLTYLAKQGVLLWNSALTVEAQKPGSHQKIWEPFTKYVLENVLAYTGIPIVFIGKDAQYYERYVTPLTHGYIFKVEHPAAAARENREWVTNGVFKKIDTLVKQVNGFEIDWLNTKKEEEEDDCPFC